MVWEVSPQKLTDDVLRDNSSDAVFALYEQLFLEAVEEYEEYIFLKNYFGLLRSFFPSGHSVISPIFISTSSAFLRREIWLFVRRGV